MPLSANDAALKALIENYFLHCEHIHRLVRRNQAAALDCRDATVWPRFKTYVIFWLSSLYVVCEGYSVLQLKDEILDFLIPNHLQELKLFRNGSFHFQVNVAKQMKFIGLEAGKMNWAEDLHAEFKRFFNQRLLDLADFEAAPSRLPKRVAL